MKLLHTSDWHVGKAMRGQSRAEVAQPCITLSDQSTAGHATAEGRIWGSYLHGIFDADPFRRWFIDELRERKGLKALGEIAFVYDVEPALDRLADVVEKSVDMEAIMALLER